MGWLTYLKATSASIPTPSTGKVSQFVDSADGVPKYKDDAGTVTSMVGPTGPTGPTGSTLSQQSTSVSSAAGVVTIDLSQPYTLYYLTLTENVTSWVFTNLPASTIVSDFSVEITQGATTAYTCVSPASASRTAGTYPWVVSSTLSAVERLGLSVDHSGVKSLFAAGVFG